MKNNHSNILLIKHSSLGDWIKATGLFAFIKEKFKNSNIILITSAPYTQLAYSSGYFNEVWVDSREPLGSWRILKKINSYNYSHVFDLQSSCRTKIYKPFISCQNKYWRLKRRENAHDIDQFFDITKAFGAITPPKPAVGWLTTSISHLNLPQKFCLFIPGCSAKHIEKRWKAEEYIKVIAWLNTLNIKSVIIGNEEDRKIIREIVDNSDSNPINLINKVGFHGIAQLARESICVIGSDTGPIHIAAATGAQTIAIFPAFRHLVPEYTKPLGDNVKTLKISKQSEVTHQDIIKSIKGFCY